MIELPRFILAEIAARARRDPKAAVCGVFAGLGSRIQAFYVVAASVHEDGGIDLDSVQRRLAEDQLRKRGLAAVGLVRCCKQLPRRFPGPVPDADRQLFQFAVVRPLAESEVVAYQQTEGGPWTTTPVVVDPGDHPQRLRLPATVLEDVREFRPRVSAYLMGGQDPLRFRAFRVPMGFYEQREEARFMARVRIAAGVLSSQQLRALAQGADRFGDGKLHITTRQDVQIHEVLMENAPELVDLLLGAGLVCRGGGGDTVRNVTADPFAGVATDEPFDVTPYALAATEYLIKSRSSFQLPRKFKVAFSSSDRDRALTLVADLGFISRTRDGGCGFEVYAGGGMGANSALSVRVLDFVGVDHLCAVLEAVKRVFDRHGDRHNRRSARLRHVVQRYGEEKFVSMIGTELEKVLQEGPQIELPRLEHIADFTGETIRHLPEGVVPQNTPGLYTLDLHPELGNLESTTVNGIASIMERHRLGLRTTQKQGLLLRDIRGQDLDTVMEQLGELSKDLVNRSPAIRPIVCAGADTCRLGLCRSRNLAREIADSLQPAAEEHQIALPEMHISGCPNACGQHPIGALAFSGQATRHGGHLVPYYRVWAGSGRGRDRSLASDLGAIPARAVGSFVLDLNAQLMRRARPGSTFAQIVAENDYAVLKGAIERHSGVPAYPERPEYYRDIGCEQDFSLAGRGPGECGAGVLDVVRNDIGKAKSQLHAHAAGGDEGQLYQAAVSAMRSLLTLRGVDSARDREIMSSFQKEFVDQGWIDPAAEKTIGDLLDYRLGDIDSIAHLSEAIGSLIGRVDELQGSIDSSLKFTVEPRWKTVDRPDGRHPEARRIDLRGVECPLNYVKAKLQIEAMPVGGTLEIILDQGEPVRNVPASLARDGQEVTEIVPYDQDHFAVKVRRIV